MIIRPAAWAKAKPRLTRSRPAPWVGPPQEEVRPLVVLIDPQWTFDLENFDMNRFFEEAKITDESISVLRSRFEKFSTTGDAAEPASLRLEDFHKLNEHYGVCKPAEEAHYFRAMDRNCCSRLTFQDFLVGCSAANPGTPHILNSFTGYVRARYVFDFYNVSRSGKLDFEELSNLLADVRSHLKESPGAQQLHIQEMSQELGEVSAITLRLSGPRGHICDARVSALWTGRRVRQELGRRLQAPVEDLDLRVGGHVLHLDDVFETVLPVGVDSADAVLDVPEDMALPAVVPEGSVGLERLAHIPFESFYEAITSEVLRGTSRLFRFHRQIFHMRTQASCGSTALVKKSGALVGAAAGGA